MALHAILKLGLEFWRLVSDTHPASAFDLMLRRQELLHWFSGGPLPFAPAYPPATYVMLWPLIGWLPLGATRVLWALAAVAALAWSAYLLRRESLAGTVEERLLVVFSLLSINPTGVAIGTGQLTVHLLPFLLTGLLMLHGGSRTWGSDLVGAALVTLAMVKPSVTVPFLLVLVVGISRTRPILLVGLAYFGLTLVAGLFRGLTPWQALLDWVRHAVTAPWGGYADVYTWMSAAGLAQWIPLMLLMMLAVLALWLYRHRHTDVWLLLGVTAIAARLWTYHRVYDNVLILFTLVALFRIAKEEAAGIATQKAAAILFALTLVTMLMHYPSNWTWIPTFTDPLIWMADLLFLLRRAAGARETALLRQHTHTARPRPRHAAA